MIALIVIAILLFVGGYMARPFVLVPRAFRNNNPGNLRPLPNGKKWEGESPYNDNDEGGPFSRFTSGFYGWRAMTVDVYGDIVGDGLDTIDKLVAAYAPATDKNDPAKYAAFLSKSVGIGRDFPLNVYLHGPKLLWAISRYEAGRDPDAYFGADSRLFGIDAGVAYLKSKGRLK